MRDESGRPGRSVTRRRDEAGGGSRKAPRSARPASPQRRRPASIAAAAAVVALLIGTAWYFGGPGEAGRAIPPLPDLSSHPAAVQEHLRQQFDAAQRAPSSADSVGALCSAYHADMFYEQAESCYQLLAAMEPDRWQWTYRRALIRADRGGGDDLIALLGAVVARAPEFSPAWLRLGDAEFKAGRYDRAAEAWDRAARLPEPERSAGTPPHHVETPVLAYAVIGLARISLVRGETQRAIDLLEDVANGAPSFSPAFRLLANAYSSLDRPVDAEAALVRARRLSPFAPYADPVVDVLARESRNSTLLLRLASEADLGVNAEWSEYLTRRAVEFDPDNPEAVSKLARVLRTIGRSEESIVYFRRYHEMVPGDHEGLAQLGTALSDVGRYSEAEPILAQALARLDDAQTHYNVGLLQARTGRTAEALASYETALERDPSHANARINLAASLARGGNLSRAARELERVLSDDPENALAHTNLGLVLAQQGQTSRAERALEEALRLDPTLSAAAHALRSLQPSR